jgi:hypothetical protein
VAGADEGAVGCGFGVAVGELAVGVGAQFGFLSRA